MQLGQVKQVASSHLLALVLEHPLAHPPPRHPLLLIHSIHFLNSLRILLLMTPFQTGHTNLLTVERGTPLAPVVAMPEVDMEEVGIPPEVLEEPAIMEGVLQPTRGIVIIPLMLKLSKPFQPNLRSHLSLMDWTTDTCTACTTRTLEMAVMLAVMLQSLMVP